MRGIPWNRGKTVKNHLLTPRPCSHCGQMMTEDLLLKRERERGERISKAVRKSSSESDVMVWKHKFVDHQKIMELLAQGYSHRVICVKLNCSKHQIEKALEMFNQTGPRNP